jgi:hypothetical protein
MDLTQLRDSVFSYISKREKPSGGFGATPLFPPTLEDTYFALKTIQLLDLKIELAKHIEFLFKQKISELPLEPAARFFELMEMFKLPYQLDANSKIMAKAVKKLKDRKVKLKELFCIFKIFSFRDKEHEFIQEIKKRSSEILFKKSGPSLQDYYYAYKVLGEEFPPHVLPFILEAQNPDGGFGFYKGTTSYTENCFFACFVLKAFSLLPVSLKKLKEFLWSCRNKDGGFGRTSQGISFLETTYYACWILTNF